MTVERSSESPDAVDDMQPLGVTVWGLERPEFGDDVVGDLVFVHLDGGDEQMLVRFKNGYGANVIRGAENIRLRRDLFDLVVVRYYGPETSACGMRKLDFSTPVRAPHMGRLTKDDVARLCREVAALEKPT